MGGVGPWGVKVHGQAGGKHALRLNLALRRGADGEEGNGESEWVGEEALLAYQESG